MDFFKVLEERHSVRAYKDKQVEDAKLHKLLTAINSAPSAGNMQAYEIVVVKDEKRKREIAEAAHQPFVAKAPIVLVFVSNPERNAHYGARGRNLYALQDATIAAAYAQLAAAALGLATCWVGAFDDARTAEIIGTKTGMSIAAIMPLGYANGKPFITERRSLRDIVHEEEL